MDLQIHRIHASLKSVASDDDSGVHLEFCFTGYPKNKSYVCAIWPKYGRVTYRLHDLEEIQQSGRYLFVQVRDDYDPLVVEFEFGSSRSSYSREYVFFGENPQQLHRPYLFNRYDRLFSHRNQNDAQVRAHHLPNLLTTWQRGRAMLDSALEQPSVSELIGLEDVLRRFQHQDVERFTKNP
jgi:hypothetical protein